MIQRKPLLLAQRLVFLAKSCWLLRVIELADFRRSNRGVQEKNMIFIYIKKKLNQKSQEGKMKEAGHSRMGDSRERRVEKFWWRWKQHYLFIIIYLTLTSLLSHWHCASMGCLDETFSESLRFQPFSCPCNNFWCINPLYELHFEFGPPPANCCSFNNPPVWLSWGTVYSPAYKQDRGRYEMKMNYKQGITFCIGVDFFF